MKKAHRPKESELESSIPQSHFCCRMAFCAAASLRIAQTNPNTIRTRSVMTVCRFMGS